MVLRVLEYDNSPITGAAVTIQGTAFTTDSKGEVTYEAKAKPEFVEVRVSLAGWAFTPDSLKNLVEAVDVDTVVVRGEMVTGNLYVDMVQVLPGTFEMGTDSAFDRSGKAQPAYQATITKAYYISKYEVTQRQWREVMGTDSRSTGCDDCAVTAVTFYDAVAFCNQMSMRKGLEPVYTVNGTEVSWNKQANGYRLPTECEWEFAAKGNRITAWYLGAFGDWAELNKIAWCADNTQNYITRPVGELLPNDRGMYDVLGNAAEWVWDWMSDNTATNKSDYAGPTLGRFKIIKGGSIYSGGGGVYFSIRNLTELVDDGADLYSSGIRLSRNHP